MKNDTALLLVLSVVETFCEQGRIAPACFADGFQRMAEHLRAAGEKDAAKVMLTAYDAVRGMEYPAPRRAWLRPWLAGGK